MTQRIQIDEDIMKRWGATIEQQYLSRINIGDQSNAQESESAHHAMLDDSWLRIVHTPSPQASQIDSSFSMPTENLSELDGDIEARSTATAASILEERKDRLNNFPLIHLGTAVPNVVVLDDSTRERFNEECEKAAFGGSLSDKLTGDDSSSDPGTFTQQLPPRPLVIAMSDRCLTPQLSNVHRIARYPNSPGNHTRSSEIFHYTYEADIQEPSSPVPAFVVVPDSGVASRVTVTPTGRIMQGLGTQQSWKRTMYKHVCVFLLTSILLLALVTLAAGVIKSKEMSNLTPTSTLEPTLPMDHQSTPFPIVTSPVPSPIELAAKPAFSIPNGDTNITFPDLDGGIVAREETPSPTTSDFVPPTRPPRTRRPTTAPTFYTTTDGLNRLSPSPSVADDVTTGPSWINTTWEGEEDVMRAYIRNLIASKSIYSSVMLEDPSSHQYSAYEWLVSDQLLTNPILPDIRILQRFALATFFRATSGANWTTSSLWLTSINECEWFHTRSTDTCDSSGALHSLEVEGNGLSGTLPPELALLRLKRIFLRNNRIGGTIPTELGSLDALEFLQLTNNALEGTLPTAFGNLKNLTVFGVGRNTLSGTIPTELGLLNSLDTLGMEGNNFEGTIPPEIGGIGNLRFLSLHNNALSGKVPSEFGQLSRLTELKVKINNLSGTMPSEICGLRNNLLLELQVDCGEIFCPTSCCTNC